MIDPKNKSGTWTARVSHQSKQVARRTFDKKRDAEEWEAAQKLKLKLGTWVNPRGGDMPLGDVINDFNAARSGVVAEHTFDTDEANLRLHVTAKLKRLPISTISPANLEDSFTELMRVRAKATVSRVRNSLSSLFAWALRRNLVSANPVLLTKLPKGTSIETQNIKPFTAAELEATISAVHERNAEYASIIEFLALTGFRWGELKALTVESVIDVPFPALIVARSKSDGYQEKQTKSGESRRVPLVTRAAEIAAAAAKGKGRSDFLFRSPEARNCPGRISRGQLPGEISVPATECTT